MTQSATVKTLTAELVNALSDHSKVRTHVSLQRARVTITRTMTRQISTMFTVQLCEYSRSLVRHVQINSR